MDDVSFCTKCGSYLKPDEGFVYRDDKGEPGVLCEICEVVQKTRDKAKSCQMAKP